MGLLSGEKGDVPRSVIGASSPIIQRAPESEQGAPSVFAPTPRNAAKIVASSGQINVAVRGNEDGARRQANAQRNGR